MVAGGALYARHPARQKVTAIRVASAGGYRPVPAGSRPSADLLAATGRVSGHGPVADLPTVPTPATSVVPRRPPALSPASTTTSVPAPPVAAPADAAPTTTTTTTTAPLAPLLQKIVPVAAGVLGAASWFDAPAGTCAHRDLPLGTVVTVTRTSTGVATTCRVNDRGPAPATNRVIDLSLDTFSKLASPDAGVI
jgi:hypothetical protein